MSIDAIFFWSYFLILFIMGVMNNSLTGVLAAFLFVISGYLCAKRREHKYGKY